MKGLLHNMTYAAVQKKENTGAGAGGRIFLDI
jgi:hypothetical protein